MNWTEGDLNQYLARRQAGSETGERAVKTRTERRHEEDALQREMVASLPLILRSEIDFFHVPNQRASRIERMRLAAMGVRPGVADLVFHGGGRVWFLELKRPASPGVRGGRLSRDQRAFRDHCRATGTPWAVTDNIGAAVDQLRRWGLLQGGADV